MRIRLITKSCVLAVVLSGCVVHSGPRRGSATNSPPPPPPAAGPGAPPPATGPAPAPTATAEPPGPIPAREGPVLKEALPPPLPPDPEDPPPVATPLPPQTEPAPEPAEPPTPPSTLPPGTANGTPKHSPKSPPAYWIWRTAQGVWKLRTTTGGTLQTFLGVAAPKNGGVSQLRITRTELKKTVEYKRNHIAFRFVTHGHIEGFDFTTEKPDQCVRFSVDDTVRGPKQIFVGAKSVKPPSNNFIVCPK